jgi:hypothetical protein
MMDLRKYVKRLENKVGETKSADKIIEGSWREIVVKELNEMSLECAKELQLETRGIWDKGSYQDAPPPRLLAMNLMLNYWLGWIGTCHFSYSIQLT